MKYLSEWSLLHWQGLTYQKKYFKNKQTLVLFTIQDKKWLYCRGQVTNQAFLTQRGQPTNPLKNTLYPFNASQSTFRGHSPPDSFFEGCLSKNGSLSGSGCFCWKQNFWVQIATKTFSLRPLGEFFSSFYHLRIFLETRVKETKSYEAGTFKTNLMSKNFNFRPFCIGMTL